MKGGPLNLYYREPENDRWLPLDRYPRRIVRRLIRGAPRPGGQARVFLNLRAGLDRLGVPYRVNDFRRAKANPGELACIIGKSFLLDEFNWKNPILFGAAVHSHPCDDPNLLRRLPVRAVLVPGPWMREMCRPLWGDAVIAWPVGIDTEAWTPAPPSAKSTDVLLYDKVRWEHEAFARTLIDPIRRRLGRDGLTVHEMRYGGYRESDLDQALRACRAMVFLCEHETQGIAYQQALSAGVPIMAWDRGGLWRDPAYHPQKVVFGPVTSVPYWDERCGVRFEGIAEFDSRWSEFWRRVLRDEFDPRAYVLENLTLEKCASHYVEIAERCRTTDVDDFRRQLEKGGAGA